MIKPSGVVFDTNVYSYAQRGDQTSIEVLRLASTIVIPLIVQAELLAGYKGGNRFEQNVDVLNNFLELPRVQPLDPDTQTAFVYAELAAQLEGVGKKIPTNDIWIAALTMQHGCKLFTFNAHFSKVEGLTFGKNAAELGL